MKKRLLLVMLASMLAFSSLTLTACGDKDADDEKSEDKDSKKSKKDKDADDEDEDDDDKDSKKSKKDKDSKKDKKDKKSKKDDDEDIDDEIIEDDDDDVATAASGYTLEDYINDSGMADELESYFNDEDDDSFSCDVYYFENDLFVDMYFVDDDYDDATRDQMREVLPTIFEDDSYSDQMTSYLQDIKDETGIEDTISIVLSVYFTSDPSDMIYSVTYSQY